LSIERAAGKVLVLGDEWMGFGMGLDIRMDDGMDMISAGHDDCTIG
jgi:hypothetical protein